MPHKHFTRTSSNTIQKKNYAYDNSNSDISSYCNDSDSNYSDNSSSSGSDDGSYNGADNSFNKYDYYKFLHELYPSQYSKNKFLNEARGTTNHKRAKKTHSSDVYTSNNLSELKLSVPFNNKIIKKRRIKNFKHTRANNYDEDNDEEHEHEDEYEHEDEDEKNNSKKSRKDLLAQGFKTLFQNINSSDRNKNINIIVNLKKGKNNIFNNESSEANEIAYYQDDEEIEDNSASDCSSTNSNNIKTHNAIKNEDIVPAPSKVSNKNYKAFEKILNNDEAESEYFKKCLSKKLQLEAIAKLEKLNELTKINKPYLLHLVDLDIPDHYKACALRKINTMRLMYGSGNTEYFKIKSWVDSFLKIPFNKYNNLPISFADGIEQCHEFMENAKKILDSVTYGLEDAKIQIMQMIGLWLVNPNALGCAIAIKGPPGTGKTTLIKEGISKILNRPFALIALGGCGDSGFIDGFDYTYEGSKHGKIIDILIQCGCMNPIILFDELDKLSDSFKGQEITGVLTHLTDSTQNTKFTDKYFSEISIDMSKTLFIFSYNDETAVNPILKDRMYKIETKGYKTKDKLVIAKDYLLPKIREEIKFASDAIIFNDELLEYIINDFTEKEDGVRNLKRCLEIIYKKLNLYRLMKPNINLFENSEGFKLKTKISFPCILTKQIIDDLINKASTKDIPYGMYV
jgi:ATP-dependent Lon protease